MIRYPATGSWFQTVVVGNEAEQLRSVQEAEEEAVYTAVGQGERERRRKEQPFHITETSQVPQILPPVV